MTVANIVKALLISCKPTYNPNAATSSEDSGMESLMTVRNTARVRKIDILNVTLSPLVAGRRKQSTFKSDIQNTGAMVFKA